MQSSLPVKYKEPTSQKINVSYEYAYFTNGLMKNKLMQLTFSFLKNPSLNLLVANPLTPTDRNRWYLA